MTEDLFIDYEAPNWREEVDKYRKNHDSQGTLRALKIYTCGVCGTKTNRISVGYWMSTPKSQISCPYRHFDYKNPLCVIHNKIAGLQHRLDFSDGFLGSDVLTSREIEDLKSEIDKYLVEFKNLNPIDDVVTPDAS